ncbi:MAG: UvrD-helicase domain-containing protein [Clostridia bacterium]|nr:UvrD-helicase domain-containing protein [Clostridia bacterium]
MKDINLDLLNPSQLTALKQITGPVMVLAGAGSGKTRLVTYRIAYLIKEMGVDPQNILAITFTNKAANEMKERLIAMTEEAENIWISTFHSMCVRILRRHISILKSNKNPNHQINFDSNFSIYTDTERDKALKTVVQNLKIDKDNFVQKLSHHISNAKNNNLSPWDYQKLNQAEPDIEEITKGYSAYQSFLANNNALDFDDLLTKTYELFVEYPDILSQYQRRFEYIHIDEFQDTNYIQYQIAKMLAGEYKNIFVVGDEDQCIYSWRGANIQNIFDFKKDFPDFKQFKLEQNYRSTKQILTIANKLIKNNQTRNDKVLWTDNSVGIKVEHYQANDEFSEAEYVANQIKNLVNSGLGYSYNDFAVLTRLNALSAPLEEKFLNYNIPYKIFGGNKFFDRVEIKNLTSYLKMLTNPYDSTSFTRIINFPKRGIGEATISNILELSEFHNTTPFNLILNSDEYLLDDKIERKVKPFKDIIVELNENYEKLEPYKFIEYLVKIIDFKSIYNTNSEEDLARLLNIDSFLLMAQEFFKNNPKTNVSEFLQSITLVSDMDEYDDKNNTVTIATVHSVKGLEFKVVFVVGLEERMFPIVRTYSTNTEMEEERRLMFVAITRAEQRLYLTNAKSRFIYGKRDYMLPSRFLKECEIIEERPASRFETNALSTNFPSFQNMSGRVSFSLNKKDNISSKPNAENLEKKYAVNLKVSHPKFGTGVITSNQGINITKCVSINFENFGVKTLSVEYAPITLLGEN